MLLKIARSAIQGTAPSEDNIPVALKQKRAVFVTIEKNGRLRGCIGTLESNQPLYQAVAYYARQAAFHDPRFEPIKAEELEELTIEISLLSEARPLTYHSPADLLEKLEKGLGVIIAAGNKTATFLPQVWQSLPDKESFLSQLCIKAGLAANEWQNNSLEIFVYSVEKIKE